MQNRQARERTLIWLLCLLAAARVFVYSAAFPLFNNVDEPMHFDLVVKYSEHGIPRGIEPLSEESLNYIVLYSTSEYWVNPTNFPNGRFPPPPWTQPIEQIRQTLAAQEKVGVSLLNYEDAEPPLYYSPMGLWWRLGQWFGIHDGFLPYWLRFSNLLFVPALIWIAFVAAKTIFPENIFLRMGVPSLLAFIPQTVFYSISNDILTPLCFGWAFICLFNFWNSEVPSFKVGVLTGLSLAATFLAKMTNLPLLVISSLFLLWKIWQLTKERKLKPAFPSLAALVICAGLPVSAWMAWCKCIYGSLTGSPAKAHAFGWTVKPFTEWWHHPIFTPVGFWTYLTGQLSTFWQGEFKWHDQLMALPGSDVIYTIFSLAMLIVAFFFLLPRSHGATTQQRHALLLGLVCFIAALGFFALSSIIYDFHDSYNPSREHPYFHAGRMMLGTLIPFLLLMVYALDRMLDRFGVTAKFISLAAIISVMFVAEVATNWPVFSNEYNWFHLR